ncbi:hypothetical protein B5T_04311 [Alloalcanivorax dieselolei B5]|uniref:Transmembrane protein n=1 Tax=Alcanivorax dieselolei (strain DSM 16502 / CGMCC 1.3690 / MCCC 1A00001 / B-5) TaxID=930169 RepID=K0CLQ9_ALCDB|nr:hypothetical protein [Alloalcanivorax dieselolei]AFT72571.1 hypothetical protein B5T_04311 [Alloalcanivorax dieselolei B5]GGJ78843.1 hypothetical protein GCM10007426_04950 [Alloalcanivorax dieselolei]
MRINPVWPRIAALLCLIVAVVLTGLAWTIARTASPFFLDRYAQAGVHLFFAVLLLILALTLLLRRRPRGPLLILAGIAVLMLAASPMRLVQLDWGGEGITVSLRSLPELVSDGWQRQSMTTELVNFNEPASGPTACIDERVEARGLFRFQQRYRWQTPEALTESRTGGMEECLRFRRQLVAQLDGLEGALVQGDADRARALLDQHHAEKGRLALQLTDVGEPLRGELAKLLHTDPASPAPLTLLDIALALGSRPHIQGWLKPDDARWYQRYALFKLDLTDLVPVEAQREDTGFGWRRDDPMSVSHLRETGGYRRFDYTAANLYCDADYARFLKEQGLAVPADSGVLQLFLSRLWATTPKGASDVSRRIVSVNLPNLPSQAKNPRDCVALARFYTDPEPSEHVITLLRRATGARVFNQQQKMLGAELDKLSREERYAPDGKAARRVYQQFEFSKKTLPLPPIVPMFTAVLETRRDTNALCQALYVMPWMVGHDSALETLYDLARQWRGEPIRLDMAGPPEDVCSLGLMLPPGGFERQTRERNQFLEQAELPCKVVLPEGTYTHSERLECRHEQ